MKKILINSNQQEEVRVALIENSWLYDLYIENFNYEKKKSNIYKGKIIHIETSLEALFVDYGYNKHGFLPIKDISNDYINEDFFKLNDKSCIKNFIKEGQDILVQVSKEERYNKGAVLTTFISLAGSYLILMPNNPKSFGISKRIEGEDRKKIKEILKKLIFPKNMGIIIRTSGIGKSVEDFQNDINIKLSNWNYIKSLYKEKNSPSLIYKENEIIKKIFRDYLTSDISEIIVDNIDFINLSKKCLLELGRKEFINKIKFHSENIPLFSYYKIEYQIESAFKRNVKLPSGGSITIDSTEALTSIDINSYKSTKGIDIEETAFNTNIEAANEIARQLRLRDLGGLIVIDFIDMSNKKNCIDVEKKLKNSTYNDKAKIKFGNISKFGLLEMSRQRLNNSLNESSHYICPRCKGNGFIRNNKSLSLAILRLVEEESLKDNTKEIHVIVPMLIGTYLLNEKRSIINNIEKRKSNEIKIIIVPYDQIKTPNYIIMRIKYGEEISTMSYLLPYMYDKNIKSDNKKNIYKNKTKNFNIKNTKIINPINNFDLKIQKFKKLISNTINNVHYIITKILIKINNIIINIINKIKNKNFFKVNNNLKVKKYFKYYKKNKKFKFNNKNINIKNKKMEE